MVYENRARIQVQHEGMVLLRRRPKTGLLAGQWEFPALTVDENQEKKETLSEPGDVAREQACVEILASRKMKSRESVGLVTHTFSHLKHFMYVDIVNIDSKEETTEEEHEERWFELEKLCTSLRDPVVSTTHSLTHSLTHSISGTQTRKSPDFVPLTKGMQKVLKAVTKHGSSKKRKGKKMGFWKKWSESSSSSKKASKKRKKEV